MKRNSDWRYLVPAIVVVAVMTQVPFIITIIFSLLKWNLARPDLGIRFAGLSNFAYYLKCTDLAHLSDFYHVLWQTFLITFITLALCVIIGFLFALLLDHDIPGKNIARTLIIGPFFVMSTASGVVWKNTIFNTTFGWYGVIMKALGKTPVDLLSYRPLSVVIFLFTWQWAPVFVLIILAGLQGIPRDILESGRLDGAGWFRMTFQLKVPSIANHLRVAIMLGLIFIIKEIGLILVTTAGGPGTRSYNLPFMVYMEIFNGSQIGRASALSVMTVILTLLTINIMNQIIKHRMDF